MTDQVEEPDRGLRSLVVRPCRQREKGRLSELLAAHHYLGYRGTVGEAVFHVAEWQEQWVAVLVWAAAAFKCGARDAWVGWHPMVAFQRLHLIANNVRFLILPGVEVKNLASRVLGLSSRRLSSDWQLAWGHPIFLLETFVDPARFAGTCYRAAGWQLLGKTLGYARRSGGWRFHGRQKLVFGRELRRGARQLMQDPTPHVELNRGVAKMKLEYSQIDSLLDVLKRLPDPRKRRGVRHSKMTLLAISVAAMLAGIRSVTGMAQWARECTESELERFGCRRNPRTGKREAPSEPTLRRILQSVDVETVDREIGQWLRGLVDDAGDGIAIDGKTMRGARRADGTQVHLLSAVLHSSGVTIGQVEVDKKSNEIPAARELLEPMDLEGCCVTADAMHTQTDLASFLVEEKNADFCLTVKENQPTLRRDIETLFDAVSFPPSGDNTRQGAWPDRATGDLDLRPAQRLRQVPALPPGGEDPASNQDRQHRERPPGGRLRDHQSNR